MLGQQNIILQEADWVFYKMCSASVLAPHVTVSLNRTPDFNDSLWFGQCFTWFCSVPEISAYVCTNAANYILMLFIIFPV